MRLQGTEPSSHMLFEEDYIADTRFPMESIRIVATFRQEVDYPFLDFLRLVLSTANADQRPLRFCTVNPTLSVGDSLTTFLCAGHALS